MNLSGCPPGFSSAQQKAWREYVNKHWQPSWRAGFEEWVEEGADIYARYGIDIAPADYCNQPDKVQATLKFMGVVR